MTLRKASVAVWAVLLALTAPTWAAVETRSVDSVLQKSVLTAADLRVIDEFVAQAVRNILRAKDATALSEDRAILLSRTSQQGQYAQQFLESAHRYIASDLELAQSLPADRASIATMNLLILIHGLNDLSLVDLALDRVDDPRAPVAFWAVKVATSAPVVDAINRADRSPVVQKVVKKLSDCVTDRCSPDVLNLMAEFASKLKGREGQDMLLAIADLRIAAYEKWSVQDEQLDTATLKFLCDRIVLNTAGREELAMRFGQLYSYVIQRYAKGANTLKELPRRRALGVIAEVEDKCIGRLLGSPSTALVRALEREDMSLLIAAHDELLGSRQTPGTLVAKLHFTYGVADDGSEQKWPKPLQGPLASNLAK